MGLSNQPRTRKSTTVTLRAVAERVGLAPGTVSAVLNDSPAASSIPESTKARIHAAARELQYRPNFFARSLRKKRTYTIGVIAEEIGDAYGSLVISGIETCLRERDYFFFTVIHRHDKATLRRYADLLVERGVEGFITVDTTLAETPSLPTVSVAGHRQLDGVTNIVLDHEEAALLALQHLKTLGHKQIAFMRGHPASSDSEDRWNGICKVAKTLGIKVDPNLVVRLDSTDPSPQLGYPYAKQLLARKKPFSALFAYNDISAIGAVRAFQEEGFRVPHDISVVGFDDIRDAAYSTPSLTTVRQPLSKMGMIAAETLLARLEGAKTYPHRIPIAPELIVRESTAPANNNGSGH
jgi:DNA-binding LacI/PurR family transcriptional regulator